MNCKNCPALEAYKATHVTSNCTFDYFAWSQSFLGHHGDYVVESGIVTNQHFQSLSQEEILSKDLRHVFRGARTSKGFSRAERLHVNDIEAAYRAAMDEGFSSSMVFECRHHDWPVGWMACRDQRFVKFHGKFSRCEPSPEQAGCGYRGVTCCDAFWGWGEKLEQLKMCTLYNFFYDLSLFKEHHKTLLLAYCNLFLAVASTCFHFVGARYFTGKPWDLPCNCGLSDCRPAVDPEVDATAYACCGRPSAQPSCHRRIRMQSVPDVNTPEDTESLTSTALTELDSASSDPATGR